MNEKRFSKQYTILSFLKCLVRYFPILLLSLIVGAGSGYLVEKATLKTTFYSKSSLKSTLINETDEHISYICTGLTSNEVLTLFSSNLAKDGVTHKNGLAFSRSDLTAAFSVTGVRPTGKPATLTLSFFSEESDIGISAINKLADYSAKYITKNWYPSDPFLVDSLCETSTKEISKNTKVLPGFTVFMFALGILVSFFLDLSRDHIYDKSDALLINTDCFYIKQESSKAEKQITAFQNSLACTVGKRPLIAIYSSSAAETANESLFYLAQRLVPKSARIAIVVFSSSSPENEKINQLVLENKQFSFHVASTKNTISSLAFLAFLRELQNENDVVLVLFSSNDAFRLAPATASTFDAAILFSQYGDSVYSSLISNYHIINRLSYQHRYSLFLDRKKRFSDLWPWNMENKLNGRK